MIKDRSEKDGNRKSLELFTEDDWAQYESEGMMEWSDEYQERCELCGSTWGVRDDLGIPLCETCWDAQTS